MRLEDAKEAEIIDEQWDKKKIFGATVIFLVVGFLVYTNRSMLGGIVDSSQKVAGVSTKKEEIKEKPKTISLPIREGVQDNIESIKQEIEKINVSEMASSSPQIQKVLSDIKALQGYPKSQAKEMCENICKGI